MNERGIFLSNVIYGLMYCIQYKKKERPTASCTYKMAANVLEAVSGFGMLTVIRWLTIRRSAVFK